VNRTCTVTGHFKGEVDPVSYTTPKFVDISPKNSPLWKTDPDQQQAYLAIGRWAKRYASDVMLDIPDDDAEPSSGRISHGFENAKDVTPTFRQRLQGQQGRDGFSGHGSVAEIDRALETARGETQTQTKTDPVSITPSVEPVADPIPPDQPGSSLPLAPRIPEGAASPPSSEAESEPASAAPPPSPASARPVADDRVAQASERGRDDRRKGVKRSAVPTEYRDPQRGAEAIAWVQGWNGQ
jgi:hypothetical protein